MSTYKYDIPMPEEYKKDLLDIVEFSKQKHSLSGKWYISPREMSVYIGGSQKNYPGVSGDPFLSFGALGLVEITGRTETLCEFVLKPRAFYWANYQQKTRFGKCLERFPGNVRDIAIAVAFILSVVLTIIQIVQFISNK